MQELFCKNKIFVRMYDCGVVIFGNWAYNWAVDKNLGGMRAMLCIKNGTIVSPEGRKKADLFIEDGKIVSVGGELPFDECWDAEGCLLFLFFLCKPGRLGFVI